MFTNKITFKNGVSVFLPAMPNAQSAENLKEKILNQKNVEIGIEGQSLRETMQALQTLGAVITHNFLDSGDTYGIISRPKTLLSRFIEESKNA
jgi:hypothetical protein